MKNIMVYTAPQNAAMLEPYSQGRTFHSWSSVAVARLTLLRGEAFEIGKDFVIACSARQALDVGLHLSPRTDRALAVKDLSLAIEAEAEEWSFEGVATVRSTGEVSYSAWLTPDMTATEVAAALGTNDTVIIDLRFLRWHVIGPFLAALEECLAGRNVLIVWYQNFVADILFGLQRGQIFSVSHHDGRLFRHLETGALVHGPHRQRSDRVIKRQKTFEKIFAKVFYRTAPEAPYRARERFLDIVSILPKSQVPIDFGPWSSPLVSAIVAPNSLRAVSTDLRGGVTRGLYCEPGGGWCVTNLTRASFRVRGLRGANVLALALYNPGGPDHTRGGILITAHTVSTASQSEQTVWLGAEPSWHLVLLTLVDDVAHEIVDLTIRSMSVGAPKGSPDCRPLTVKIDEVAVLPQAIADVFVRAAGKAGLNGLHVHWQGETEGDSTGVVFIEQVKARLGACIDYIDPITGFVGVNRIAASERVVAQERLDVAKIATALSHPLSHYLNRLTGQCTAEASLVPAWEVEVDGATWRAVGFHAAEGELLWTCRDVAYIIADMPLSEDEGKIQLTIDVYASSIPFNDESRIEIWAQERKVFVSELRAGTWSGILPSHDQFVVRIAHQAAGAAERSGDVRTLGVALSLPKLVRIPSKANVQRLEIAQ